MRAADGFDLPRSHLGARPFFDDDLEEDADEREQAARQAAEARGPAGGCQHSGRNLPTSHRGNAISCTHRRRHEHISSKKRDKAGDDGGNSGGIGCDEVSSMGGGGKVLRGRRLIQAARRIDKFVGDEHDDEGGSGEGDVGDGH